MNKIMDWINVPIWTRGQLELRRIDVMLAILFVMCVGYYGVFYGWQQAVIGGAMFILFAMVALWML